MQEGDASLFSLSKDSAAPLDPETASHIEKVTAGDYIVDHYCDYEDYDDVVQNTYGYKAYIVIPRMIFELLPEPDPADADAAGNFPKLRVLDIGCGTGLSSKSFFEHPTRQFSVIGTDISEEMLEQADDCADYDFEALLCHNLEEYPWPDEIGQAAPFHVVTMLGVMEFIGDPPTVFATVAAAMAPGGLFGIVVPKALPLAEQQQMGIRTHDPAVVRAQLQRAGFEFLRAEELLGYKWSHISVNYEGSVWRRT
jgi:predicted TPR repeat methyltransferase